MQRASAFVREAAVAGAERVEESEGGVAPFHARLPECWALTTLWADAAPADATAEKLASLADALQAPAGLDHRQIVLADQEQGARLAREFSALGWTVST